MCLSRHPVLNLVCNKIYWVPKKFLDRDVFPLWLRLSKILRFEVQGSQVAHHWRLLRLHAEPKLFWRDFDIHGLRRLVPEPDGVWNLSRPVGDGIFAQHVGQGQINVKVYRVQRLEGHHWILFAVDSISSQGLYHFDVEQSQCTQTRLIDAFTKYKINFEASKDLIFGVGWLQVVIEPIDQTTCTTYIFSIINTMFH